MKKTSTFQTIILVVFGLAVLIAVAIFSISGKGGGKEEFLGKVVVWGTLPEFVVMKTMSEVYLEKSIVEIVYKEKRKSTFDRDLIEALASGVGPDIVLLPQDLILRHSNKIYPIPYESMSERAFKDSFIEEGELYLNESGIFAVPITIDPMVMYWNRDMFSSAGIVKVPRYWDEFYKIAQAVTIKDRQLNISRSTISFGEFQNVTNAKEIISMLIMQAGNPITVKNVTSKKGAESVLSKAFEYDIPPAVSALRFYTEFSNPTKSSYSWNRSLPTSFDMFTGGDLAVYFGFASELSKIKKKNPNLNFDVAKVPQVRDSTKSVTFGEMQGLSILKQTKNIPAAFQAIILLSSNTFVDQLSKSLNLPPVRRDLLVKKPAEASRVLFYDSALISKAWLDPSPIDTENIFKRLVENIISGRSLINLAVISANTEIQKLLE